MDPDDRAEIPVVDEMSDEIALLDDDRAELSQFQALAARIAAER